MRKMEMSMSRTREKERIIRTIVRTEVNLQKMAHNGMRTMFG